MTEMIMNDEAVYIALLFDENGYVTDVLSKAPFI